MCQDILAVYAPCAHSVDEGKQKCKKAKSLRGLLMKCKPANAIKLVIDWCPECKAGFEKVFNQIKVPPVTYGNFWDPRLMERYWAIKSQHRLFYAVDAEKIGPLAFVNRDRIQYLPISQEHPDVTAEQDTTWELYALQVQVRRLQPVSAWIEGYSYVPAERIGYQLHLCKLAIVETEKRAYNFGHVE
ncbi:palmitoyl- hydrolase [Fusarium austroafricanum]|uniref:Palmitoyl- hydrolase n=1 Tax=Fusarium austroafricanum TaxID=2364996 RepID=A0A8H4KSF7_9HYPO|nr:palmitoyl- hydrolase [Fusarium austroafricanum]